MVIQYVFLSHFRADFVAGHLELRGRTGAQICLGEKAASNFAALHFANGETLDVGQVRFKVLEIPGHAPEGVSILVYDFAGGAANPHSVLTGDTLFIGDVGRPDQLGSLGVAADDLTKMLYTSIQEKLMPLPDGILVYPAHGARPLCGLSCSTDTVSTMGEKRQYNYALQPMSEQDFVALVASDQPDAPQYLVCDAVMNRRERLTLDESLKRVLKPLSVQEALKLQRDGTQLLDVREPADYEGAHFTNCLNIRLGGRFATFAGMLLDQENSIVIIAEPGREEEGAFRLGRIGYDHVAGYRKEGWHLLRTLPKLSDARCA